MAKAQIISIEWLMEHTPPKYNEAIEKTAIQIKSIQGLGFEITYRHLFHSEIEVRFTKRELGAHQGIEVSITRTFPSHEVHNAIVFSQHLENIYCYLREKVKE